jgi:cystathionine beta-lyase
MNPTPAARSDDRFHDGSDRSRYGFDHVDTFHLRSSGSGKWNKFGPDVLAAWVADMDFAVAPPITEAIERVVRDGMHGYPPVGFVDELAEAFCEWTNARTQLGATADLVTVCDDAVQALHAVVVAMTKPGDNVLLLTPIYPPFLAAVETNGRYVVEHRMAPDAAGVWRFDAATLLEQMEVSRPTLVMLCQPHNPTGRVFSAEEMTVLAAAALDHGALILSDEIHSDLLFAGGPMRSFASLGEEVRAQTITVTSANKAFNLAALKAAEIVFGTDELQARFRSALQPRLLGGNSSIAVAAHLAAYREGAHWLGAVNAYLAENRRLFADEMARRAPSVRVVVPEGTYLSWLDFSAVPGVAVAPRRSVGARLAVEALVGLNEGQTFGPGLESFARANLATSRTLVIELATRIGAWVARQHP